MAGSGDGDDVARLERWFGAGLIRPDPTRPSTVDLSRVLASIGGVADAPAPGPGGAAIRAAIGPSEHLVFVLIDGLGYELVESLPPESFLRRHLALELRSVFPSATASAITSLATGEWPARHGVPGWWTHLPERDLTLTALPFVERWSGRPASELGIGADVWPCATLLGRYTRDARTFQPLPIVDSAYSRYFRGTSAWSGYQDLTQAVDLVLLRLSGAAAASYTYLYFSSLDELQHAHGPGSKEARALLLQLDGELERLALGLPRGARIALSADHGLVEVGAEEKDVLGPRDELVELLLVPPAGEPRFPQFHVKPGQTARFRELFARRFGEGWALLTPDEVERLELLGPGPLGPETRARLGDFVAISHARRVILYRPGERPTGTELLRGYHGGLLPAEVRIPLVVV